MDINDLEGDEFLVECEVRSIKGSLAQQIKELIEVVEQENKSEISRPTIAHKAALKHPPLEIKRCLEKLQLLQISLKQELEKNDSDKQNTLKILNSRLLHVFGRVKRISSQKKVVNSSLKMIDSCQKLLAAIKGFNENLTDAETSVHAVSSVEVNLEEEEIRENDEASVVIESSNKNTTNEHRPVDMNTNIFSQNLAYPGINNHSNQLSSTSSLPPKHHTDPLDKLNEISMMFEEVRASLNVDSKQKPPIYFDHPVSDIQNIKIPQPNLGNRDNSQSQFRPFYSKFTPKPPSSGNKWNNEFSGAPGNRTTIHDFIVRAENMQRGCLISEDQLVFEVQFLLKGSALQYYWKILEISPRITWRQLRELLINRYQIQDRKTDPKIRDLMYARKQNLREKESFIAFYNAILDLSLSMEKPLPDTELIEILKRNMRVGLRLECAGDTFRSLSELFTKCAALEETWEQIGFIPESNFQTRRSINEICCDEFPPVPNDTIVETNNDYSSILPNVSAMSQNYYNSANNVRSSYNNSMLPNSNRSQSNFKQPCWNCNVIGHNHYNCPQPLKPRFLDNSQKNSEVKHCACCSRNCMEKVSLEVATGRECFQQNLSLPKQPMTNVKVHEMKDAESNTDLELLKQQKS